MSDRKFPGYDPPAPRSAEGPPKFGTHFARHPLHAVSLVALATFAVVLTIVLLFVIFVWDRSTATDERFLLTIANQTGGEITLVYSLGWDFAADGSLTPAGDFDFATQQETIGLCSIEEFVGQELASDRQFPEHVRQITIDGERILFSCYGDLVLQTGESRRFRVAWGNPDGTKGKDAVLHRLWGKPGGRRRVIDMLWADLVAADFSIVFTEETPFQ